MRLAIIHFEANEAEIFEDVIRGTQETILHHGIFDPIKKMPFSGTPTVLYIILKNVNEICILPAGDGNEILMVLVGGVPAALANFFKAPVFFTTAFKLLPLLGVGGVTLIGVATGLP